MRNFATVAFLAALTLSACGKNSTPPPPSSGVPNAKQESGPSRPAAAGGEATGDKSQAQAMFETVCAVCHGMDGTGNGPGAAALDPKPRNYTDAAWQASITDDQIKETILKGGAGVGKSPSMPGQPQLSEHPEVLDDLVKMIRKFGKKP
jgi:mono/diheme cytochrome c family protein